MLYVTKVFDEDCDICKHMSKHDRATFESFPEITYSEMKLDDVINNVNGVSGAKIYKCLEKYAVNSDYTIDLPVYVYLDKQGDYQGHHVGPATIVELRDMTKQILAEGP